MIHYHGTPEALRLAHAMDGGKLIDDSTEWADTLHAAADELRRLHARVQELERERDNYKLAYDEWQDKTDWVQQTALPGELGKHRADVLRERIESAAAVEREACAKACEEREQRSNREDVRATCRLCAKDIRALAVVNQSLTTASTAHPAAPAAQGDALPREDFAWMVVQEACETEPADEDDPECIRILRRDLKSAVLAAFLRREAARPRRITPHNTTANPNKVA